MSNEVIYILCGFWLVMTIWFVYELYRANKAYKKLEESISQGDKKYEHVMSFDDHIWPVVMPITCNEEIEIIARTT